MSKKRAFVRYSKQGKIVPGSLILTSGSHPNGPSTWKEVPADLCCGDGDCTPQLSNKIATTNLELSFPYSGIASWSIQLQGSECANFIYSGNFSFNFLSWDDVITFLNTNFSFFGLFSYVAPNSISLQISSVGSIDDCTTPYTLMIQFAV
jgi:hypothetical protein